MRGRWILAGGAVACAALALLALGVSGREKHTAPPRLGRLPDFVFTAQSGAPVGRAELATGPWIADFIFTRCVISCPQLTAEMQKLRARLPAGVKTVSFSVDPAHDTPEVLRDYAAARGISSPDWLFLTGDPEATLTLVRDGFKLALELPAPGAKVDPYEPILHGTRFVLVDRQGEIRGYYGAFDEEAREQLFADVALLLAEGGRGG